METDTVQRHEDRERELHRNRNLTAEQFLIFFCVTGREKQNVIVEKSHLSLSDSFIELLHLFPGSFKVQRYSDKFDKYNFNSSTQFLNYNVDAEIVEFQVWAVNVSEHGSQYLAYFVVRLCM